ncbi:MAG: glutamyl-tRNA reductase [Gammaproteobacteria bacterium]
MTMESLAAIGISHKSAPLSMREQVAFPPERIPEALHGLARVQGVDEAAILSTCNRTELYCHLQGPGHNAGVIGWLGDYHRLPTAQMSNYLYQYHDQHAVRHTLRVACGLDSLVLGEPQILGQLKSAYQDANRAGTMGRTLGRLFQHAFSVAKQVRRDTAIGANPVSVASTAVSLARQIFADFAQHTVLLIGAGETIELAATHLRGNGIAQIVIANRSVERARALAARFNAEAVALAEIAEALPKADIIISSTASQLPILGKGAVESALKRRKHRPVFMVDIAVPRDIEPEVGELRDVYLYTIDDLEQVIEDNLQSRRAAAMQADEIIGAQVERFMGWLRGRNAVGTIRAYRQQAKAQQHAVLAKAQRMLAQGNNSEDVLRYLAHTLTNKLIHAPTQALNQAGKEGHDELIKAARTLLSLPDEDA